jgi:hypothetical protein
VDGMNFSLMDEMVFGLVLLGILPGVGLGILKICVFSRLLPGFITLRFFGQNSLVLVVIATFFHCLFCDTLHDALKCLRFANLTPYYYRILDFIVLPFLTILPIVVFILVSTYE